MGYVYAKKGETIGKERDTFFYPSLPFEYTLHLNEPFHICIKVQMQLLIICYGNACVMY